VLLKITHAPLVAGIWSFESISDYLRKDGDGRSTGVPSLGAPVSSISFKKSAFRASKSYPRTLVPAALSPAPLAGAIRAGKSAAPVSTRPAAAVSKEVDGDLRSLVVKLSSQVEELTAMVAGQEIDQQTAEQDAE